MRIVLLLLVAAFIVVIAALPAVRSVEREPVTDEVRMQAPGFFVHLAHGSVHVETTGPADGAPVVLIHGLSIPSYVWDPTFEALGEAGFRAIRYDMYGGGYSDRPDVVYDEQLFRGQVIDLLDSLEIESAHLMGLSMGGAVAASVAAQHPERVRRVVLIAPFNTPADIGLLESRLVGPWFHRVIFVPRLAGIIEDAFDEDIRPPRWRERYREQMRYHGFSDALLSTLRHFIATDPMPAYRALGDQEREVLVIWGKDDEVVRFEQHERLVEATRAELIALEGTGHAPHIERPEIVEAAVNRFLTE